MKHNLLIFTITYIILVIFCCHKIPQNGIWLLGLTILLLGLPMGIAHGYAARVKRSYELSKFDEKGIIRRFFSGYWVNVFLSFVIGIVGSMALIFDMLNVSKPFIEWLTFFLVLFSFLFLFKKIKETLFVREVIPFFRLYYTNKLSILASITLSFPVLIILLYIFQNAPDINPDLRQFEDIRSATVGQLFLLKHEYSILEANFLGKMNDGNEIIYFLILFLLKVTVLYSMTKFISAFFIPKFELRRLLLPLTIQIETARVKTSSVYWLAFFTTILVIFLFQMLAYVEKSIRQSPYQERPITQISEHVRKLELVKCELILQRPGECFKLGTVEKIKKERDRLIQKKEETCQSLDDSYQRGISIVETNIDNYLDWHFSLAADYAQLANLVVGNAEQFLLNRLEKELMSGSPFLDFEQEYEELEKLNQDLEQTRAREKEILDNNKIIIDTTHQETEGETFSISGASINIPQFDRDYLGRILSSGGAGFGIGGATAYASGVFSKKLATGIAKSVAKKSASKGVMKVAGKMLTKILGKVSGKWATGAGGAATGAALGSFIPIPVVGNVIGATIGLASGVAVSVLLEKALIEWDEHQNRPDLRQQIRDVVREVELKQSICSLNDKN